MVPRAKDYVVDVADLLAGFQRHCCGDGLSRVQGFRIIRILGRVVGNDFVDTRSIFREQICREIESAVSMALVYGISNWTEFAGHICCGDAAAYEEEVLSLVVLWCAVAFGVLDPGWPFAFPVCEARGVGDFGCVVVA